MIGQKDAISKHIFILSPGLLLKRNFADFINLKTKFIHLTSLGLLPQLLFDEFVIFDCSIDINLQKIGSARQTRKI